MNKFIKITIGSTIIGLILIMISFCYRFELGNYVKSFELQSLYQSTMQPPLSISPAFFIQLGFLLIAAFGLRRKKV